MNFPAGHHPFPAAGAGLRLVEHLTRFDEQTINYSLTVTGATSFTRRGRWRTRCAPRRDRCFACHEGNYGLPNILAGARAEEAAAR